jgi:hypothetical protein
LITLYSYNSLCHLKEAGHCFIIRLRDDHVEGLLGRGAVPEGCFDVTVERVLVRTRSVAARTRPDRPEIYRWVDSRKRFDAIGAFNGLAEYPVTLRVVRRRLPGKDKDGNPSKDRWLNLVTNLPAGEFPARWLVRTYKKRWSHEVGFRHLKKVVGMEDPKTRVFERAGMEAWGRLILYNACSLGARGVLARKSRGAKRKRARDLTTAYKGMLRMIRGGGGRPRRRQRAPHARPHRRPPLRQEAEEQVAGEARLPPLTLAVAARRRPRIRRRQTRTEPTSGRDRRRFATTHRY